ncbi:MAG: iron-sulfur cluster assembly scaffold protein [Fimbriimonadaceae bacterium]
MLSAIAAGHVHTPRNVGPLEGATHYGQSGIPGEGPYIQLWFKISRPPLPGEDLRQLRLCEAEGLRIFPLAPPVTDPAESSEGNVVGREKGLGQSESGDSEKRRGEGAFLPCSEARTSELPPNAPKIEDAAYRSNGCFASIASASVVAEMLKGRTVEQALSLEPQDVNVLCGGLPEGKGYCAEMAVEAIQNALLPQKEEA